MDSSRNPRQSAAEALDAVRDASTRARANADAAAKAVAEAATAELDRRNRPRVELRWHLLPESPEHDESFSHIRCDNVGPVEAPLQRIVAHFAGEVSPGIPLERSDTMLIAGSLAFIPCHGEIHLHRLPPGASVFVGLDEVFERNRSWISGIVALDHAGRELGRADADVIDTLNTHLK